MFGIEIKEVAVKELTQISDEVLNQKRSLHETFNSLFQAKEGVFVGRINDKGTEIKSTDTINEAISEAGKLKDGLWLVTGNRGKDQPQSPRDIVREVRNDTNLEEDKDIPEAPRYIITKNESLENHRHPCTGVFFEKKVIELPSGEKVEGVYPRFESVFDAKIQEELYLARDVVQFRECNRQLVLEIERNSKLQAQFSAEQIDQIYEGVNKGTPPDGYVWHHDAETGKIQLVDAEIHAKTGHDGGRSLWGGGSDYR